jgi:2-dehydropantoate 2-reductase
MAETIDAGNACGCSIDAPAMIEKMFAQTATMGHYKTSMMIDFQQRRPLEVESMLGEPVRQALHAGVDVPYMQTQYELVRFLDRINRGEVNRCQ